MRTFTSGGTIWYRNFQKRNKWERGVVIKKKRIYLINNCHGIFQKHVDQIRITYLNIDIELKNDNLENTIDNGTQNEY